MNTECNQAAFEFHPLGRRDVVGRFDGGTTSSDGGGILLREVEVRTGILRQFAAFFTDYSDADLIEHTACELVAQRVYGLALGYEDLLDHDDLRHDPLLAALVGKGDPTGQDRLRQRDRGKPLAGKSTLNRLELTPADASWCEARSRLPDGMTARKHHGHDETVLQRIHNCAIEKGMQRSGRRVSGRPRCSTCPTRLPT